MFCARCGKEIDNDSTFCPFCGQRVDAPVENKKAINISFLSNLSLRKTVPVIVTALIVLAVIIGIRSITGLFSGNDVFDKFLDMDYVERSFLSDEDKELLKAESGMKYDDSLGTHTLVENAKLWGNDCSWYFEGLDELIPITGCVMAFKSEKDYNSAKSKVEKWLENRKLDEYDCLTEYRFPANSYDVFLVDAGSFHHSGFGNVYVIGEEEIEDGHADYDIRYKIGCFKSMSISEEPYYQKYFTSFDNYIDKILVFFVMFEEMPKEELLYDIAYYTEGTIDIQIDTSDDSSSHFEFNFDDLSISAKSVDYHLKYARECTFVINGVEYSDSSSVMKALVQSDFFNGIQTSSRYYVELTHQEKIKCQCQCTFDNRGFASNIVIDF